MSKSTTKNRPEHGGLLLSVLKAPFGRRRQLIVDPQSQLRAVAIPTGLLMTVFGCVLAAVHIETVRIRDAMMRLDPDIARELGAMAAIDLKMMAGMGAVIAAGVALLALLESHRSSGAAHSLGSTLADLAEGRFGARASLRKNDHLQGLKGAMNRMAERLEERGREEAAALEALAARLEAAKDEAERDGIACELRQLASAQLGQLTGWADSSAPSSAKNRKAHNKIK
ncbi:MAG: hypothetical protein JRH16_13365 [Deltaproteobacteria bacterium]|nr:hypothetical protein [Deltaproteobacteria bacterium]MBW2361308.1 hypothetical protein [Deltaproteobacteria bacterium]